jgi:hypothetical protein
MGFQKAIPVDLSRVTETPSDERLSLAACAMIWLILAGFSWFGLLGLFNVLTA